MPFGCATCHGNKGQGGSTNYSITDAAGQDPDGRSGRCRHSTPCWMRYTADTVLAIITYGRADTPMPTWGVAGGGAMNAQQLDADRLHPERSSSPRPRPRSEAAQYGTDGGHALRRLLRPLPYQGVLVRPARRGGGGAFGPNLTDGSSSASSPTPPIRSRSSPQGPSTASSTGPGASASWPRPSASIPRRRGTRARAGGMPYFAAHAPTEAQIQAVVIMSGGCDVGGIDPLEALSGSRGIRSSGASSSHGRCSSCCSGSVYLVLSTDIGARLGLLLTAAGFSGLISIMAVLWLGGARLAATSAGSTRGRRSRWSLATSRLRPRSRGCRTSRRATPPRSWGPTSASRASTGTSRR